MSALFGFSVCDKRAKSSVGFINCDFMALF